MSFECSKCGKVFTVSGENAEKKVRCPSCGNIITCSSDKSSVSIWNWYKQHNNAINAVLDIACDFIPGGRVILGLVKGIHAMLEDKEEIEQDHKIEDVQQFLSEIKPVMSDLIENVERSISFQQAKSLQEARMSIENSGVHKDLKKILPHLSQSISRSVSHLSERITLNDRYELFKCIGRGGQGEVYQGIHLLAKIPVAVKLLPKELGNDPSAVSLLRQEYAILVQKLIHPNIVQYRDLDQDSKSGRFFIVMDFVSGRNLREILLEHRTKGLPLNHVVSLLKPISEALDFAHTNKIVHCDLKPENILIRKCDNKVFLTDFGLASEIHSSLSRQPNTGIDISGTLPYMAPEQYTGAHLDACTDIWALGVITYEMLAGYHPFKGVSFEHYMKLICEVEPDRPRNMTWEQWDIIKQMLQKDKTKRPASAREILNVISKPCEHAVKVGSATPIAQSKRESMLAEVSKSSKKFFYVVACVVALALLYAVFKMYDNYRYREKLNRCIEKGDQFLTERKFQDACEWYNIALSMDRKNSTVLQKIKESKDKETEYYFTLGDGCLKDKKTQEALSWFKKVLTIDKGNKRALEMTNELETWDAKLRIMRERFSEISKSPKQISVKIKEWQEFLQLCEEDNPYSEDDNQIRNKAKYILSELKDMDMWYNRLEEMKQSFLKVLENHKLKNVPIERMIDEWERFLTNFGKDNPHTEKDNEMREQAQKMIVNLKVLEKKLVNTIEITPKEIKLYPEEVKQFEAEGRNSREEKIAMDAEWEATGGTIDQTGFYRAGSIPGPYQVGLKDKVSDVKKFVSVLIIPKEKDSFFPIYGVMPGKTTVAELAKLGKRTSVIDDSTRKPYPWYEIKDIRCEYNDKGITQSVSLSFYNFMKVKDFSRYWETFDFNWEFSYNEWLHLLKRMGFSIFVKQSPTNERSVRFSGDYTFQAEISATREEKIRVLIILIFDGGDKQSTGDSRGTLYEFYLTGSE